MPAAEAAVRSWGRFHTGVSFPAPRPPVPASHADLDRRKRSTSSVLASSSPLGYASAGILATYSDSSDTTQFYRDAGGSSCAVIGDMRMAAMKLGIEPRTSSRVCSLMAALVERNGAHG